MDWSATMLAAAGVAQHPDYPMDGISLLSEKVIERDLFWRMKYRDQKAARSGSWKWLSIEGNEFLYDLGKDQRERANLAKRRPEKYEELKQKYLKWEASVPPIPDDAKVSSVYGPADLAAPASP